MNRDRLKKLASDERFIPGIYNYCDRWCERCPQTSRCLNFSISEEEFSDPETRDIRNQAFWKKLSEILEETFELLKEGAEKWGIELETVVSTDDLERGKAKDEAAENHLVCRAAKRYSEMVRDWFREEETLLPETATAAREGVNLKEAVEVIQWYQHFIFVKLMRAVRGKVEKEDEEEEWKEFPSDSDGSAKIALIAIDRSIGAWAVIRHYRGDRDESIFDTIGYLDRLREAAEKTFPRARSFVRPGFDTIGQNGPLGA